MFQVTPHMRLLVAVDPVDGRKGIDSLAQLCREKFAEDPFSGCIFVFRNKSGTTLTLLNYDGQGYWIARKRLSKGRFRWWPTGDSPAQTLEAYQAQILMAAGDPSAKAAPVWRTVKMPRAS
ncbi:MAG: IS66 family insertion sequence element accessory protein TnpB [Vulcanimicrobiota bacterium]